MNKWLLKTEPSTYSFADLERETRTTWDGVRNAVALKHLRSMKVGDECFVYHTGDEKRIVGVARVAKEAYPDPRSEDSRNLVVDLEPLTGLSKPVSLAEIKADSQFADWELVRQPRLSVMPVSDVRWTAIMKRAG